MGPMAAMAAAQLMQSLIGQQQTGAPAPAPMLGASLGVGGGNSDALSRLAMQNNFGGGMIGGLPSALQNLPGGADTAIKTTQDKKPPVIEENPDQPTGFFANLDKTLSSPSKTLLIGGLGQLDPRLALAGLLASGFINGS